MTAQEMNLKIQTIINERIEDLYTCQQNGVKRDALLVKFGATVEVLRMGYGLGIVGRAVYLGIMDELEDFKARHLKEGWR